jgi:putative two-component system response regulator
MSFDRKTIIMVDDDLTNLTIGSSALEKYYNVITLNSGARLLKILERKTPDLILLDVDMPELNGYETIKMLKQNESYYDIPVIFLTAKNDATSEIEGLSLGAMDYIAKPFSPPLLIKRIELHLLVEFQKRELLSQKRSLEIFNENLLEMVSEKTKTVLELQNAIINTMSDLVECRDDITGGHIERTQNYLRILINALQNNENFSEVVSFMNIELVVQSAQLHDIGKLTIDDQILRKPGQLTPEEFEKIKEHAVSGEKIIERIEKKTSQKALFEQARILALSHHEKWDGTGYPFGLKGEDIPFQGRLMAIADVYDALVSERPYKKPIPHSRAVEIIKDDSGTRFDPALVEVFLSVAEEFAKVSGGKYD